RTSRDRQPVDVREDGDLIPSVTGRLSSHWLWPVLQAARGTPGPAGGLTVPRAERRSQARGAPSITGKLAAVTNRIVDRGELSVPGEGASLSEHAVVLIRPDAPVSR